MFVHVLSNIILSSLAFSPASPGGGKPPAPETATSEDATSGANPEAKTTDPEEGPRTFAELTAETNKDFLFGSCRRRFKRASKGDLSEEQLEKRRAKAVQVCERNLIWEAQGKRIDKETGTFRGGMSKARKARCATALCWGPSNRWAFEPLAELPISKTFAFPGSGVGRFINGNGVNVRLDAGFRFWFAWDWASVAVYLSSPNFAGSKETIRISGSSFEYPVSLVRRPLPGLALGLFGDMLWVGLDYNQLRNGSTDDATRDPKYPANEVVSHAFSISIAIAPVAGFRNGIGTMVEVNRQKKAEADAKKAADKAAADAKAAADKAAADAKAAAEQAAADAKEAEGNPDAADGGAEDADAGAAAGGDEAEASGSDAANGGTADGQPDEPTAPGVSLGWAGAQVRPTGLEREDRVPSNQGRTERRGPWT